MPVRKKNEARGSAKEKGFGRILWFLGVVFVTGAGVWVWSANQTEAGAKQSGAAVKSTVHLETFVINLADPDQRSYLRVGIDLGLSRATGRGEAAPPVAEMRDTILGVLSKSQVEELQTEAGKTKLKGDLLHALQARMPGQAVEEVYFTEFLIQR